MPTSAMSEAVAVDQGVAAKDTWLRQWRVREGLTQTEVAERAGVSRNRLSEIESGHHCELSVALKLETITGIAPKNFFRTDKLRRAKRT